MLDGPWLIGRTEAGQTRPKASSRINCLLSRSQIPAFGCETSGLLTFVQEYRQASNLRSTPHLVVIDYCDQPYDLRPCGDWTDDRFVRLVHVPSRC